MQPLPACTVYIVSLSPLPTFAKIGVLAMSSTCYMSYLPTIPMLLNTSGILNTKFTDKDEMYRRVQDFVNQTIQGEKQQYLNIICSRVLPSSAQAPALAGLS